MKYMIHQSEKSYCFKTDFKINFYLKDHYLAIALHKDKRSTEYRFDIVDSEYHEELHVYTTDERVSFFVSDEVGARLMQELKNVGIEVNEI